MLNETISLLNLIRSVEKSYYPGLLDQIDQRLKGDIPIEDKEALTAERQRLSEILQQPEKLKFFGSSAVPGW